ncbi:MAG: nucleotide exchange factor GrpE [Gaiellaceae bacterium]
MTDEPREDTAGNQVAGPGPQPGCEPGPEETLAALVAERDRAVDNWKRAAADLENVKKRAARERQEYVTLANERLVTELLPILDDLERALVAAGEHEGEQLEEGVRLVHRSLAALLEKQGVKEIDTAGRFDPHVHEALLAQPSEAETGSVLDVIQKGYTLGDRVVRPARVIVAE